MSDPTRELLDRVAGVSLRAPLARYEVRGLSFGAATLTRNDGRWSRLTLTLDAEPPAARGAARSPLEYPMEYWLAESMSEVDIAHDGGIRSLLVDHALLSHPGWIVDATPVDVPLEGPAARVLGELRAQLEAATEQMVQCPRCRTASSRSSRWGMSSWSISDLRGVNRDLLRMLGMVRDEDDAPAACPHAPMRQEALKALYRAHPELAFEVLGVLVPTSASPSTRFLLGRSFVRALLVDWTIPPGRERDDGIFAQPLEARVAHPGDDLVEPVRRAELAQAAEAWGVDGALTTLMAVENEGVAAPVMPRQTTLPPLSLLWPEGVVRPAPTLPPPAVAVEAPPSGEAPKPARAKRVAKASRTTKTAEAEAPADEAAKAPSAAAPQVGQEMMTAELRALGYGEAKVKALLREGRLEKSGFGWYRWKG